MQTQRKKQTQRQKNVFAMTSGGFVIVVRNNSFILYSLPINYLKGLSTEFPIFLRMVWQISTQTMHALKFYILKKVQSY